MTAAGNKPDDGTGSVNIRHGLQCILKIEFIFLDFYQAGFPKCGAGSKFGTCRGKTTTSWMQHSAMYLPISASGAGSISEYLEELLAGRIYFFLCHLGMGSYGTDRQVQKLASTAERDGVCSASC